jgi:putative hydrolase of the HAD superfamily
MIKLVLFDLGNTLVDYHRGPPSDAEKDFAGLSAMAEILAQRGTPVSCELLVERFYRPLEAIMEARRGQARESPLEPLLAKLPGVREEDADLHRELLLAFQAKTAELAVALPAADMLRRAAAQGVHTALASNTPLPGYCHDLTLRRLGLLHLLERRFYSYELGLRKPSLEFIEHCLGVFAVSPEQTLMVGDSLELDVAPARALGMNTLHLSRDHGAENARAIERWSDLLLTDSEAPAGRICRARPDQSS